MTEELNPRYPLLIYIWEHWLINLLILVIAFVLIVTKVFFYTDKEYTASVSILPSAASFSGGITGQLSAIAGLAGLNMPMATGQSQEMYKGILLSRRLLKTVLFDTFTVKKSDTLEKIILFHSLKIKGINRSDSLEKAFKTMRQKVINIDINPDNDILSLQVTLRYPELAAQVANRMTAVLDQIVQTQVQKEYREQLSYLNNRIAETEINLKVAENNLQSFLERVKNITEPRNQIEEIRLRREIELQSVIYAELQKQRETLILQNMINLSPVKILDKAEPPFRKSRPKRILLTISLSMLALFFVVGANASILVIRSFKKDYFRHKGAVEL